MLRIPAMPDIVEDMGQPLDYGLHRRDVDEDAHVDFGATAAGLSFVQGSSTAGGAVTHPQAGGEPVGLVRRI